MDTEKTVLGVYLILFGLVWVVFHKQVSLWVDDVYGNMRPPWYLTGKTRTVTIIVLGGIAVLIGVALLIVVFGQP